MVEVEDLTAADSKNLLQRLSYAHLGCSTRGAQPYVVPIHYIYHEPYIYFYTTDGKKTDLIAQNPQVCLQIEEVVDARNWSSVMVTGNAVQLTGDEEITRARNFILAVNPTLTPALSVHWMDDWVRSNTEVIYQIAPAQITGRATVNR